MQFDSVKSISPSRSKHKLYNKHFFDTHIGWFVPVWQYDCAPTTAIKLNFNLMLRSKLIPQEMYGGIKAYFNAFFVPYRLLDGRFEDNITGGDGPNPKPYHNTNLAECLLEDKQDGGNAWWSTYPYTLHDYFGLPTINPTQSDLNNANHEPLYKYKEDWIEHNLCPYFFAAYHKIWNDYCRPEAFVEDDFYKCDEPPATLSKVYQVTGGNLWAISDWLTGYYKRIGGDENFKTYLPLSGVRRVCNNKDYFQACLPVQQKGVVPTIGLQGVIPVEFFNSQTAFDDIFKRGNAIETTADAHNDVAAVETDGSVSRYSVSTNGNIGSAQTPTAKEFLGADANAAIGFDLSELRVCSAIQKWQEICNVCGTRYTEFLRGMYSAAPRDDRLQRAEWIGGSEVDLSAFTTVTTADSSTSSVGDDVVRLGGAGNINLGNYFAPEYGCIIVTMHIKPEITYNCRLDRSFLKLSRFDWHNPLFNGIGEDAVRNCEIWNGFSYSKNTAETGKQTFGFIPRNAAMCTAVDYVSGSFATGGEDAPKTWIRDWVSQPNLNANFLMCRESEFEAQFGSYIGVPFECCVQSYCDAILPVPANPAPADGLIKY